MPVWHPPPVAPRWFAQTVRAQTEVWVWQLVQQGKITQETYSKLLALQQKGEESEIDALFKQVKEMSVSAAENLAVPFLSFSNWVDTASSNRSVGKSSENYSSLHS